MCVKDYSYGEKIWIDVNATVDYLDLSHVINQVAQSYIPHPPGLQFPHPAPCSYVPHPRSRGIIYDKR